MEGHPIFGGISHDSLCLKLEEETKKRVLAETHSEKITQDVEMLIKVVQRCVNRAKTAEMFATLFAMLSLVLITIIIFR